VEPVNDAPVAVADSFGVVSDSTLAVAAPGVLGNDSDTEDDSLTATLTDSTDHGSLSLSPDGAFSYAALSGFAGTSDSFAYAVSDPGGGVDTTTVQITVVQVNRPPVATADSFEVPEDSALTVAAPGVLDNDSDPNGDSLSAAVLTGVSNGSLSLDADGGFTYTPAADFAGEEAFSYQVSDGQGETAQATATIAVTPVNDAPTISAIPDTTLSPADSTTGPLPFTIDDIDTPVDSLALTATTSDSTIVPPSGLALAGSDTSRTVTVTPAPNVDGTSTITVAVSDGEAAASTSFAVTATAISNAPPVVETPIPDDTLLTPGPPLQLLNLEGSIFEDPDGTGLSFSAATDASDVVRVLGQSPAVVLLKPQAPGTAQVTLTATDALGATVRDTFAVVVEARSPGAPQPIEAARSFVAASDSAALPLGSTGASTRLQSVTAGGAVEARFFEGADTAAAPAFVPTDSFDTVSPYRWVIEADGVDFASASVAFSLQDTSVTGVGAPEAVSVLRDAEGDGDIEEVLETSFVADDSTLVADGVTDFSTFRLASNDSDNPLPVELVDFTARTRNDGALLQWRTASETNNAGFEVQHKGPASDEFETVSFVESQAAGGTTTTPQRYRYSLDDVAPGTHEFQLRQVDIDGTAHRSEPTTLTVRMEAPLRLTPPAPNPVRTQAQFRFAVRDAGHATVALYNVLGQRVARLYDGRPTPGEMQSIRLSGTQLSRFSSGVYFVRVKAQGQTRTRRMVIVR